MAGNFDENLAKIFGVKKVTGLDKFSLFGGGLGLIADTIGIFIFARDLFLPNQFDAVQANWSPSEGGLFMTALLGLYFMTLLMWFLIRLERSKLEVMTGEVLDPEYRAYDQLTSEDLLGKEENSAPILLVPFLGVFYAVFMADVTRVIFFLLVFMSFLPAALWIFALTANPWLALGVGLFASAFLSQYATFFALILDKFFH